MELNFDRITALLVGICADADRVLLALREQALDDMEAALTARSEKLAEMQHLAGPSGTVPEAVLTPFSDKILAQDGEIREAMFSYESALARRAEQMQRQAGAAASYRSTEPPTGVLSERISV